MGKNLKLLPQQVFCAALLTALLIASPYMSLWAGGAVVSAQVGGGAPTSGSALVAVSQAVRQAILTGISNPNLSRNLAGKNLPVLDFQVHSSIETTVSPDVALAQSVDPKVLVFLERAEGISSNAPQEAAPLLKQPESGKIFVAQSVEKNDIPRCIRVLASLGKALESLTAADIRSMPLEKLDAIAGTIWIEKREYPAIDGLRKSESVPATEQEEALRKLRATSGSSADVEAAYTEARLKSNGFNSGRGLVALNSHDTATSYQDLLSPGFIPRLKSPGPRARVLDSGAGSGRALHDLSTQEGFPQVDLLVALQYSLQGIDLRYINDLENRLRDRFQLRAGKLLEKLQSRWKNYFTHILDVYGPFAYMRRPDLALRIYGKWLKIGGVLDTVYDKHRLIMSGGTSLVLPNLVVFDETGREATDDWSNAIRGMEVLREESMSRESFIPGSRYLDVYQRTDLAKAASSGGNASIWNVDGFRFIHTDKEQIDVSRSLALRKIGKTVIVPPLEEIGYLDGRPPVRIFRWERHKAVP